MRLKVLIAAAGCSLLSGAGIAAVGVEIGHLRSTGALEREEPRLAQAGCLGGGVGADAGGVGGGVGGGIGGDAGGIGGGVGGSV